jgi:hypothetical protein
VTAAATAAGIVLKTCWGRIQYFVVLTGITQTASVMDIPYLDACLIESHLKTFYTYYPGGRVV